MLEKCQLCKGFFEKLQKIISEEQVNAFGFLSSEKPNDGILELCDSCNEKINVIVKIKQSATAVQESKPKQKIEKEVIIDTENKKGSEEILEDVDLVELDELSSYYAELDDDPDFVPNNNSTASKKLKKPKPVKKLTKVALKCQLCALTFSRVIALRRHFLNDHEHIVKSEWKCQECNEVMCDKATLIGHFIKVHVAINQCKKCGKKFRLARTLRNHIANYCPQISGHQKPCDVCDKLMPSNMLASHKAFSHICPNCNHILPNRREKCKHLREIHKLTKSLKLSSKLHNCRICQENFSTSSLLGSHLVTKHPEDTDLVTSCPKSGCKFKCPKGSIRLRSHLQKFHNNEFADKIYKFECRICYGRFKSADILKTHIMTKHDESHGRVKCPYCPYALPTKRKSDFYRHHFRVAHPELTADIIKDHDANLAKWKADLATRAKIQCLMCSFAGVKSSNMVRHYVDVHGYDATIADAPDADDDMPDGALCIECGEIFTNLHGLMRHFIKAHSKPGGEPCLYCPFRYNDLLSHIDSVHKEEKSSAEQQVCKKCMPAQKFNDFNELLRHTRSYHRKKHIEANNRKPNTRGGIKKLCENCGKLAKHKSSECPKLLNNDDVVDVVDTADPVEILESAPPKKKYVPVHLSGTCPYCEYKFSDLLGHIRHGHEIEKTNEKSTTCILCSETFGSVRELVSHRQLHPQFKQHVCSKCALEFDTVVELRFHRAKLCSKSKKFKKANNSSKIDSSSITEPTKSNGGGQAVPPALATLMMMANNIENNAVEPSTPPKAKAVDYEGRGTVSCHLCKKAFVLKTLLKRHYITSHGYDAQYGSDKQPSPNSITSAATSTGNGKVINEKEKCKECQAEFENMHLVIRHFLEHHAVISGQICPYCDCKYGAKKFDKLDEHVAKHHVLEMQSPVQTCGTCKTNFNNYEALKVHRQIHEGGNRPRVLVDVTSGEELSTISVHPRVGAKPEISNRGGLKCQLCNAFKLRKDHLKLHYIRHHGYDPKAVNIKTNSSNNANNSSTTSNNVNVVVEAQDESSMQGAPEPVENRLECPSCHSMFDNNHYLIKHLLKSHCVYSGWICPYCPGHFPSRFIDLQSHVTTNHMDQLTGYNSIRECKVCLKQFSGYAELRDHVQLHGDGYRDILGNNQVQAQQKKLRKQSSKNDSNYPSPSKTLKSLNAATTTIMSSNNSTSQNGILARRTKILVPVSKDSTTGQLRLTSDNLQKAIVLATKGGQVENLPGEGLVINSDQDNSPLAGIIQNSVWN